MVFGLSRKAATPSPLFSSDQPPEEGIGIIFKVGGDGGMYVKSLSEDGPAARSGMILSGDCLLSVDGKTAYGKPTDKVVRMLLGPFGSEVELTLKRWKDDTSVVFSVALTRGLTPHVVASPQPNDLPTSPSGTPNHFEEAGSPADPGPGLTVSPIFGSPTPKSPGSASPPGSSGATRSGRGRDMSPAEAKSRSRSRGRAGGVSYSRRSGGGGDSDSVWRMLMGSSAVSSVNLGHLGNRSSAPRSGEGPAAAGTL
jgi:hypothetical protein